MMTPEHETLWERIRVAASHLADLAEHPKPDDEQWVSWVAGCVNGINEAADVLIPDEAPESD